MQNKKIALHRINNPLGRCTFFCLLVFLLIQLATNCSVVDPGVNQITNENRPAIIDSPTDRDLMEIDHYESADEYFETLMEEIVPKLGLVPLQKTDGDGEFELRIWTNLGGLHDPRLFGVRVKGVENNAYFFYLSRDGNQIKERKEHIANPKSGWDRVLYEVTNRLITTKSLVRDPQFSLDRDETVILLEVRDKREYHRVFYAHGTSFGEGKRLIEACEYFGHEFDLDLNCHSR